jgi:hypothetical protein
MLPLSQLEYSIAERQIELRKMIKQQHILQSLGSIRKQKSPLRFVRTALSVVRFPVEVLRSVHVLQRASANPRKECSAGVCETRLS